MKSKDNHIQELLKNSITQSGSNVLELSNQAPRLVVFLRHFGCTFCREACAELAARRRDLEAKGTHLVFVHMGDEEQAAAFFKKYDLEDVPRISDPQQQLYRSFDLQKGSLNQLLGPINWWRGFKAGILDGHGVGKIVGSSLQMPGVFLIYKGRIQRAFRHRFSSDRPDYDDLAACPIPQNDKESKP